MQITEKIGNSVSNIMEGIFLVILGSSHVVIDTFYCKEQHDSVAGFNIVIVVFPAGT